MSEAEKAVLREYARKIWALVDWEDQQTKLPDPVILSKESRAAMRASGGHLLEAIEDIISSLGELSNDVLGVEP